MLIVASVACAQSPATSNFSGPVLPETSYRISPEQKSPIILEVPTTTETEDFWIVSTRKCPQRAEGTVVGCEPEYHYFFPETKLQRSDKQSFEAWLDPSKPLAIIVHGSFIEAGGVSAKSKRHFDWLKTGAPGEDLQVVYFTWPSDMSPLIPVTVSVEILGRRAAFNGIYLADFISKLPTASHVGLMGHSHGARAVCAALHFLEGGQVQGFRPAAKCQRELPIRAVLTAAAMEHQWLDPGGRYGLALQRTEAFLNVTNQTDWVLSIYPLHAPFVQPALGLSGISPYGRRQLPTLKSTVREWDVSPLIGTGHEIQAYYKSTTIAQVVAQQLFQREICPADQTLQPSVSR